MSCLSFLVAQKQNYYFSPKYKSYFYRINVSFLRGLFVLYFYLHTCLNVKTGVKAHMFAERRLRGLLAPLLAGLSHVAERPAPAHSKCPSPNVVYAHGCWTGTRSEGGVSLRV